MKTRYELDTGRFVSPEHATAKYEEGARWDGSNHISLATGSQWAHENLYRSRAGQWYVVRWSQYQGVEDMARSLSPGDAAAWLLRNEYALSEMPDELHELAEALCE